MGIILLDLISA